MSLLTPGELAAGVRPGGSPHPVEMNRLGASAQQMRSLVGESGGQVNAPLRVQGVDQGLRHQHRGVEGSAVAFDAAGDVDRVPEHGELQLLVTADVPLDYVAVVDADAHSDGRIPGSVVVLVP